MTKTELRDHLAYSAWASRRVIESSRTASTELLPPLIDKLEHIFMADRTWLSRAQRNPRGVFRDPGESYDLDSLARAWEPLHSEWQALVASADPDTRISYKTFEGTPYENCLADIVLHVVNHASYHRGQVSALMRSAGLPVLATDLIEYLRAK